MGLSASLVREFQSWFTSKAAAPLTRRATASTEQAMLKAATMEADSVVLSHAAKAVRTVRPKAAIVPVTAETLMQRRRMAVNAIAGDRRELIVKNFLRKRFPKKDGFRVVPEQYLRDQNGRIAKEQLAREGRRLDFVVFKDDAVVSTVEVTSYAASKTRQSAKEARIRKAGGRYLLHPESGKLLKLPPTLATAVLRLT